MNSQSLLKSIKLEIQGKVSLYPHPLKNKTTNIWKNYQHRDCLTWEKNIVQRKPKQDWHLHQSKGTWKMRRKKLKHSFPRFQDCLVQTIDQSWIEASQVLKSIIMAPDILFIPTLTLRHPKTLINLLWRKKLTTMILRKGIVLKSHI